VREAPPLAGTRGRVSLFEGLPAEEPTREQVATGAAVQLAATTAEEVGTYVADRQGRSLYRFDRDTADPSRSTCDGDCADVWPPLLVEATGSIYVSGVDPSLVAYVERADGTCQVTIGGWPVYYYSGDQRPGDVNGQGVGGTWFAVAPDGAKAGATDATPSAPGNAEDGY
jgi:predicted lipoprotein with Yx(FWY)xxD motif